MKIIRTFEDANLLAGVGRQLDGLSADFQLLLDIRTFQMQPEAAVVEFAGKIVDKDGRIAGARIFRAAIPGGAATAQAAAGALDQAFGKAAAELVIWTAQTIDAHKAAGPKKAAKG
jgi:phospholipid/cholesterol/gamma-HCH transport system substrate-binding protein